MRTYCIAQGTLHSGDLYGKEIVTRWGIDIHTHRADSPWCIAETNTAL